MTSLGDLKPYSKRDPDSFLKNANVLTQHHIDGCPEYSKIFSNWSSSSKVEDLPYLHVGVFKEIDFRTSGEGIKHLRPLNSSSTSSGIPSVINLDTKSSKLQSESSIKILEANLGNNKRPLLILDSSKSLRNRSVSARIAAALSLKPLASEIHFLNEDLEHPTKLDFNKLEKILDNHNSILVYGFTWVLWKSWGEANFPNSLKNALKNKEISFVHSGGWKKLEKEKVDLDTFNSTLKEDLAESSKVIDFYGLVEQVGIVFPLDEDGYRKVPVWADCIVRDIYTKEPIYNRPGQLQLINTLAWGAPYHSVLTEDMAIMPSPSTESDVKKFKLIGRLPKAEARGCSNV